MNVKLILDNYLGKNTRHSEKDLGDGTKQVCDLDTGDCYTCLLYTSDAADE